MDVGIVLERHRRIRSDVGHATGLHDQLLVLELVEFRLKARLRPHAGTRALWKGLKFAIGKAGKDPNSKYLYNKSAYQK
jgi:hypothetical protein